MEHWRKYIGHCTEQYTEICCNSASRHQWRMERHTADHWFDTRRLQPKLQASSKQWVWRHWLYSENPSIARYQWWVDNANNVTSSFDWLLIGLFNVSFFSGSGLGTVPIVFIVIISILVLVAVVLVAVAKVTKRWCFAGNVEEKKCEIITVDHGSIS